MLKIRTQREDWREVLTDKIDDPLELEEKTEELFKNVLNRLAQEGIDYQRAYQQKIGAFEILQWSDSPEEANRFKEILHEEAEKL